MSDSRRYLGIELSGAKNQKTAVAALEYYPKERKIFLLDIYERVCGHKNVSGHETGDEALLELIEEIKPGVARIGINIASEFPPCTVCTRKTCPLPSKCTVPAVKWMRETTRKAARSLADQVRVHDFTPYTQRPIELWMRYQVMPKLPDTFRFEIDETLGGNKAPLVARMNFLRRHLSEFPISEVWPKLTVSVLSLQAGISRRTVAAYRQLEQGIHAREEILDKLVQEHGIFIYERDVRKLSHNLSSFDAFICAYTALLSDIGRCTKAPSGFPASSGWVQYPCLPTRSAG